MSAILSQLIHQHPDKDERLLAASSLIVRLEREALVVKLILAGCVAGLEATAASLRAPPLPLPRTAEGLDKLVREIRSAVEKAAVTL